MRILKKLLVIVDPLPPRWASRGTGILRDERSRESSQFEWSIQTQTRSSPDWYHLPAWRFAGSRVSMAKRKVMWWIIRR